MIGTIARGLVFALAGALVIDAAVTHQASQEGMSGTADQGLSRLDHDLRSGEVARP